MEIDVPEENRTPRVWPATLLRPAAQPRWLASGRIPRAAITILVGDEGIGKSLLWVWAVAAVTTGKPLPEFGIPAREPGHVILVLTEDDWSTVVRPRLEVAGGDLAYVHVICTEPDGSGAPIFPRDMALLYATDHDPALIVVDAWLDTVGGGLSVKDPQQARKALHPWKEAAVARDVAVLLLTHTNRLSSGNPRDKYGATGELRKKARMTLFAQQDDDGYLLVGPEKSNVTRTLPASKFTITSVQHFPPSEEHDGTVPELIHVGDSDRTAADHIAETYDREHGEDPASRTEAEVWLADFLGASDAESVSSQTCKAAAKKSGISERSLQRAVKSLGVTVTSDGFPRVTHWSIGGGDDDA